MSQSIERFVETASQTAGPYVHIGCVPSLVGIAGVYERDLGQSAFKTGALGDVITITGAIFDGAGEVVRDALVESWQADARGLYPGQSGADPKVSGFCRFAIDAETGEFSLRTIKPGAVTDRNGTRMAPHISLWIVARGINIGLSTRLYFEDEDNGDDPLLARVEPRERIDTMLAKKTGEGAYRFDVRLQGAGETVFLDL